MERLQKYIASSGYTSRRKAEDLIREGRAVSYTHLTLPTTSFV